MSANRHTRPLRAIFMAKHKRSAARALAWLVERGVEVVAVVCPPDPGDATAQQRVDLVARRFDLPITSDDNLYSRLAAGDPALEGIDLVLSFLFWKRIRRPLIELPRRYCLNFHPAPLPELRGLGGYNVAILEGHRWYGVSCHHVAEEIDAGDIVRVVRFPIDPQRETALSLDLRSQPRLLALFQQVLDDVIAGRTLPRTPQGPGRYIDRAEFEQLRVVRPGDDIERKIRAFWYPPYPGAVVEMEGRRLTVVDDRLLSELADLYRRTDQVP
ncbi:methionyl-tRNA formyltransferase [Thermoleophilum album]|uniref:Methionyl-tRNA formyltransferase n=1 Tax=Thermoleophilum album TaxID=29539 RepID=A0A1H6FKR6_THEAL|nr:formyltransferase family protein [Thermoleophilum album]SEH10992.1 methionyl-tRNA formyltransferase [Thermoleophilum album]